MKKLLIICVLLAAASTFERAYAQQAGVKTNLLYDATATFNFGVEFRLGDRTSLDIPLNWNPFTFGENRKWRHVLVQPEFRLWTKETFRGHFFGLHAHYAFYNVGNLPRPFSGYMRSHRFEGWLAGAGVSYGYRWNFSHRWAMEATVGVGYAHMDYDRFTCGRCGEALGSETKHYFGPTKVGLSLIYNIGKKRPAPVPVIIPVVVIEEKPAPAPYTPRFEASYVVPEVEEVKRRSETVRAYLDFAVNKHDVVAGFRNNSAELQKINDLVEEVRNDANATITGVTIAGYASPEGPYEMNRALSEKRAAALKNFIQTMYGFPDALFAVEGRGEDWATLEELAAGSSIPEKDAVLAVIRGAGTPDERERKLAEIAKGDIFRLMNMEFFPKLRRTEYELHYTVVPFTLEKAVEVFKVKPSSLSLDEMFRIANAYPKGSDGFNQIIETAARVFPLDDTANLNAAASALSRGDMVMGAAYLAKVGQQTAEYHNNMGILFALRGEWEKAAGEFRKALSAGSRDAGHNLEETERKMDSIP